MLYELARVLRYPRMPPLHGLSENRIYDYVRFLRETAEIVVLNPLLITPIRDVNDTVAMQTAVIGEANILYTRDRDRHGTKAGDLHTTPALGAAAFGPDGQAERLSHFPQPPPCSSRSFFSYSTAATFSSRTWLLAECLRRALSRCA